MLGHPDVAWCDRFRTEDADRARWGGKAAGLAWLLRHGFEVPPFLVLAAGAGEEAVDALVALWREAGWSRVAVRSSAVDEDAADRSFAGIYESVLGVEDEAALRAAIERCRASARSERARAYREVAGLPEAPVAVVVQEMVEGEASGVLFTRDPDEPDRALVTAAWGLGEGVVQGRVPVDVFRVAADGAVEAEVADKDRAVRLVDGALAEVPVPAADRRRPCLDEALVRRLAERGRRLEERLGRPQDVEFTVVGDRVVLLQVRPITVPLPRGRRWLWDNSNIVESFHGPVSPLTYTFARDAYAIVYQLFCEVMGVPRAEIRANAAIFPRMIGLVRGRIYYNLDAWYRVVALLPGYRWNRAFLEQMMGVAEAAPPEAERAGEGAGAGSRAADLVRLVRLGLRMAWRAVALDGQVRRFRRDFDRALAEAARLPRAEPHDLLDVYHFLEARLLWAWSVPIVNDFFVMIGFGLLRALCARHFPDRPDLAHALLAGEGGLDSAAPARDLVALAERARGDAAARAVLEGGADDAEAWRLLGERAPKLRAEAERWLERWGDRAADELKLEQPTLRERPEELVALLRSTLRAGVSEGEAAAGLRAEAEALVARRLSGARRALFRAVLGFARRRVRDRENLRFLRTRIFARVREIFLDLGAAMAEAGAIDDQDDVFWLTVDEAFGWVRGTTPTVDLRGLVRLRRAEYERWAREPAPADRFRTWGPVWRANRFAGRRGAAAGDGALAGQGVCPGVAEGPARVVSDPRGEPALDGEVLVAYRTDPGWVPLFPGARAIVVERGGPLSHAAVVAREMGIPTVVGVAGVTGAVRSGERLRVDGGAGTVERLP